MVKDEAKGIGVKSCLLILGFVATLIIAGIVVTCYLLSSSEVDEKLKQ